MTIFATREEVEEFAPAHSRPPGILVNRSLLTNFGEKEFLHDALVQIFITSLHPDRASIISDPAAFACPVTAKKSVAWPVRKGGDSIPVMIGHEGMETGTGDPGSPRCQASLTCCGV